MSLPRKAPATLGVTGASNDGPPPKESSGEQDQTTSTPPADIVAQEEGEKLQGDSAKAVSFLGEVQPTGPWALTAIHPDRIGTETNTFYPGEEQQMLDWIETRNGVKNLYFHLNEVGGRLKNKASKEHMKAAHWLHVDVDPKKGEDIQEAQERILKTFLEADPKPTLITFSGGGYQAFWKLKYPFILDGNVERAAELEAYNRTLEQTFGGDNCHNVDRIMRLPYTVNLPNETKRKKGRTAALAKVVSIDKNAVYPLGEFTPAAIVDKQEKGGKLLSEREPIKINGNIPRLTDMDQLDEWKVPDRIKSLITSGHLRDIEGPKTGDDSRSGWLFDCICGLARCNVPPELIYGIITDKEWAIAESVIDKGRTMDRYARRQISRAFDHVISPELRELNDSHAVILCEGGKTRIMCYAPSPIDNWHSMVVLQSFQDFRNSYCNRTVEITNAKGKPAYMPLGEWWIKHPHRRQYRSLTFAPGAPEVVNGDFNLWQGFGYEPKQGDWSLLRGHVTDVLANGNAAHAEYIIRWAAWSIQHPAEQAEVALVFRGARGTGKGTFARALMQLFGQHGRHVSQMKQVAGNFNAHLRDCCLLFADEAYTRDDRKAEAELKRMITEPTLQIEAKGRDAVPALNHLHVVMASNNDWVAPAGTYERRFAIFDVSDCRRGNKAYFRALHNQLQSGGYEAMLHDLLNRPLDDWHPRDDIPQTDALQDQKALSLTPYQDWMATLLDDGELPGALFDRPNTALSQALLAHARQNVPGLQYATDNKLGRFLRQEWGCQKYSNGSSRGWQFPPLLRLRKLWEERYGAWQWADSSLDDWRSPVV